MTALFEDDRKFVRRLVDGDEEAFERFFTENAPRLYRFALTRMGHDEDLAEEAVQATLVRCVPKLSTYRGEARLFTWLCTFCRREIAAIYRKRNPAAGWRLVPESPEILAALESLGADADPEDDLLRGEAGRIIRETLDHLPARYGDALEWKYVEGLSVREIGSRLAIGTTAAQSLLARARRAFRDAFPPSGVIPRKAES